MFRQVKSALLWYHLYKFRKTVMVVVLLLSIVLFSQWIYADIVEYLTLRDKLEYLDILLPLKWGVIFFNIALSVLLILRLFKTQENEEKNKEKYKEKVVEEIKEIPSSKKASLNNREQSFLHTKKLNTHVDNLVKR